MEKFFDIIRTLLDSQRSVVSTICGGLIIAIGGFLLRCTHKVLKEFSNLCEKCFKSASDFRAAIKFGKQELLNSSLELMQINIQKINDFSAKYKSSYIPFAKSLSKKACSIVEQYNKFAECYNFFVNHRGLPRGRGC